jgi:hypothetical protein
MSLAMAGCCRFVHFEWDADRRRRHGIADPDVLKDSRR